MLTASTGTYSYQVDVSQFSYVKEDFFSLGIRVPPRPDISGRVAQLDSNDWRHRTPLLRKYRATE